MGPKAFGAFAQEIVLILAENAAPLRTKQCAASPEKVKGTGRSTLGWIFAVQVSLVHLRFWSRPLFSSTKVTMKVKNNPGQCYQAQVNQIFRQHNTVRQRAFASLETGIPLSKLDAVPGVLVFSACSFVPQSLFIISLKTLCVSGFREPNLSGFC